MRTSPGIPSIKSVVPTTVPRFSCTTNTVAGFATEQLDRVLEESENSGSCLLTSFLINAQDYQLAAGAGDARVSEHRETGEQSIPGTL